MNRSVWLGRLAALAALGLAASGFAAWWLIGPEPAPTAFGETGRVGLFDSHLTVSLIGVERGPERRGRWRCELEVRNDAIGGALELDPGRLRIWLQDGSARVGAASGSFGGPLGPGEGRRARFDFELTATSRPDRLWVAWDDGLSGRFPRLERSRLGGAVVWELGSDSPTSSRADG